MRLSTVFIAILVGIILAACNVQERKPGEVDLVGTAAVQATLIIQQAQATALVLDAQRQAIAMIAKPTDQDQIPSTTPEIFKILPMPSHEAQSTTLAGGQGTPSPTSQDTIVELLGVGIGAEGNFIEVYFIAAPAVAGEWYQGNVSVTEETSGTIYNEIPVMPVIGPLFGKPVEDGQIGYVMLVNAPMPLRPGSFVTVNLGEYRFEHIPVK